MRMITFDIPEGLMACDQENTSHPAKLKTRDVLYELRVQVLPVRFPRRFSGQEMYKCKGGLSGESTPGESWLCGQRNHIQVRF